MLITDDYKDQLRRLHEAKPNWGSTARRWSQPVIAFGRGLGAVTVLDYGSGTGALRPDLESAGFRVSEYDPGMPGLDASPENADLVACLDVLEHIEPDCLGDVLAHVGRLAFRGVFAVIALYPAGNILPDGRNAHLIVQSPEWWKDRITSVWSFPCRIDFELLTRPSRNPAKPPKRALVVRMEKT